jgi:hypothetical protein
VSAALPFSVAPPSRDDFERMELPDIPGDAEMLSSCRDMGGWVGGPRRGDR